MIKQKTKNLYSFDIFDTLITRRVAMPTGIFALMQEKLDKSLPENFREDFYLIRINSEKYAREICNKENGTREIIFDDIYSCMQEQYKLSNDEIEKIKQLEIQTELENLLPIQKNIDELKNLIQNGNEVVLISDMYHTETTIRMFLCHIDKIFNDIKIYVSSEYKKNKHSGQLFTLVQEIEGIAFKNWSHYGDNIQADIKKPKSFGIRTIHTPLPELMPYEKEVLELYPSNSLFQAIVGSARLCRMNVQKKNQDKYNFGASYAAPILYNYINWIIDEALEKGYKTLHFIARDGYIPKIVADIIIQKRNLDIKTKYIYGSRMAWRVPCEENYEKYITIFMNDYLDQLSLSFLSTRLQIDVLKLNSFLNLKSIDEVMDDRTRLAVKKKMLFDEKIKNFILDNKKEARDLLIKYIKQEFDLSSPNIAMIDINGSGNTQDLLSSFINQIGDYTLNTYYIATSYTDKENPLSIKHTYCPEPKPFYHYIELLTRAKDGQTLGYKEQEYKIIPILESGMAEQLQNWGIDEYIDGVIDSTKKILDHKFYFNDVNLNYTYHDFITIKCSKSTADILGEIPFAATGIEKNISCVAPKIPTIKLLLMLLFRVKLINKSEFPHLTYARTSSYIKLFSIFIRIFNLFIDFYKEMKFLHILKKNKNTKIMFWGASLYLQDFLKKYHIKYDNIIAVIDMNYTRWGSTIGKYNIISPEQMLLNPPDLIISTVKNNHSFIYYKIFNYLRRNELEIKLHSNIFE